MKMMATMWCALAALPIMPIMPIMPVSAQTETAAAPAIINLGFKADVLVDGTLANIEPDPSLAPVLQALVRKRVGDWRYEISRWQGKPVPMSISQKIVAEAVPVPTGGFTLRIKQVSRAPMQPMGKTYPPDYPGEARLHGVSGTVIYAIRVDAQGKAYEVALLSPASHGRDTKSLQHASAVAIAKWTFATPRVDGAALECHLVIPIQFALDNPKPDKTDLTPYRARYADACPAEPELVTKVMGTVL